MKKNYFLFLLLGCITHIQAQVGINTQNPSGLFHIKADTTNPLSGINDDVMVTTDGKVGIGTTSPSVKLDINTGGTSTTPIQGFKLKDGNEGLGKILTSDATGKATWMLNNSSAILGDIPTSTITNMAQVYMNGYVAYTGMNITLPVGSYQINFTVWAVPIGSLSTDAALGKFCSIFFSLSNTSANNIPPKSSASSADVARLLSPIRSIIINPQAHGGGAIYYGSGAIPVEILDNPASPNNMTTIYIWTYMSNNNWALPNPPTVQIDSKNSAVGDYGPYTQLYAIPFYVQP